MHMAPPPGKPGPHISVLDAEPRSEFTAETLARGRHQVTEANCITLAVGGHEVLPRLLEAIGNAEHSVHIEVMLFFNDDAGYQVRDALLRRLDQKRGELQVRVIYDYLATTVGDPFLSKGVSPLQLSAFIAPLRGAGAHVLDSSLLDDRHPERLQSAAEIMPMHLRESVLNFPYEVRRAYKRLNAATVKALGRDSRGPIRRLLAWAEKHELALAEQLTPHRMISRYMVHDHRKLCIIDGKTAFCGGMNIGREYLFRHAYDPHVDDVVQSRAADNPEPWTKWHDTCAIVEGPAVNRLQRLFLEQFARYGGSKPKETEQAVLYPPPVTLEPGGGGRCGGGRIAVVETVPGKPSEIEQEALSLIDSASEVALRNPYLVRGPFLAALARRAAEGAKVLILGADDHNDSVIHQGFVRSWYPFLSKAGIKIHECANHFTHAKVLSADKSRALVGSFNYNNRSSAMDFEVALVVDDATFAGECYRRVFSEDIEKGLTNNPPRGSVAQYAHLAGSMALFELWATFL